MASNVPSNPVSIVNIPEGWKVVPIGCLCQRVTSGATPLRSRNDYFAAGSIPWFKTQELKNGWLEDSLEHVTDLALEQTAIKIFPENTVLIAMYGDGKTITNTGILRRPAATNQACCAMIVNPSVCDFRYLFYALQFHRSDFIRLATGGAQRNLSVGLISRFQVRVPPIQEQHAMASLLGALDHKIDLSRRMNETLETIAHAIFQSWFMNFDSGPNSIETVPQSGNFGAVAENPKDQVSPRDIPPETPYIGLEHMPRKSIALADWGRAGDVASNKFAFRSGDILFGKLRPYFHKVGVTAVDGVCSTDILVIRPKRPDWFAFVLGHASSGQMIEFASAGSTGTKMPRTSWNELSRFEICLPPVDLAKTFNKTVQPLIQKIQANIHESRTLSSLRDTLLPRLISGEIRIKTAEKMIEAHA